MEIKGEREAVGKWEGEECLWKHLGFQQEGNKKL